MELNAGHEHNNKLNNLLTSNLEAGLVTVEAVLRMLATGIALRRKG